MKILSTKKDWRLVFFVMLIISNSNLMAIDLMIDRSCDSISDFSQEQKDTIIYAYMYGKDKGFGYTMAAIAWKESCAGKYLINFSDPSAGIYHALIPGVIKQYTDLKDSQFVRNVVGQMLVSNKEFASSVALDHLKYWQEVHNGDFKKIIKSYNKGFSWSKNQNIDKIATNYYNDIVVRVEKLQKYIPKLEVEYKNESKKKKFYPYAHDAKSPDFYLMKE